MEIKSRFLLSGMFALYVANYSGVRPRFIAARWIVAGGLTAGLSVWLSAVVFRVAPAADPQWPMEWTVGRFEIHSDFDVAEQLALPQELARLSREVTETLKLPDGRQVVHIVLFESSHEYERYMHNYFPALPRRRAMFLQDRGPGMLFAHWHQELEDDLRHEVTHALLNEGPQPLPLWLDEGLAEYFETASPQRFQGNNYLAEVIQRARRGWVPSLKQLEGIHDVAQFSEAHYRDSWSWIHFLIHRSTDSRQLLVRFLEDHRGGAGSQLPLSRQLHSICQDTNLEFQQHFLTLSGAIGQAVMPGSDPPDEDRQAAREASLGSPTGPGFDR